MVRFSWWTWSTSIVLIILFNIKLVHLISHQSQLCEPRDLTCGYENNVETCRMKYYKLNSSECKELAFDESAANKDVSLGNVELKTYHYDINKSYKSTAFNISLSNIHWKQLKFRFKQDGNEMKNTCRELQILNNATLADLFYDCLWSNESYEGKSFYFEYEARNDTTSTYRKYIFRVPYAKSINDEVTELTNWELFAFVEVVKSCFGLTTFILHWQPLPEKFFTHDYNVSVISNDSGIIQLLDSNNVTCHKYGECQFTYNKWYGNVQFWIQPMCNSNSSYCFITKTQVFLLGGESTKPMLIGIVSVTLILPVMLYVLFLLKNHLIYKSKKWMRFTPKVLIVFTPSISSHLNVVLALVEYLKTYCNVQPLVDELHIITSKSRDPFKWCNEAFKSADFVMVVASPYHKYLRLTDSVYQNTDILLLRLLRERLVTRGSKTQFFSLILPYCSEKDIPNDATNLRRFQFPEDLNKMLRYIHREWKLPGFLRPAVLGGKEDYKVWGTKLSNAIEEARADLKKNEPDYQRMIEEIRNEKDAVDSDQEMLTCVRHGKENCCEFNDHSLRNKSALIELAQDTFREFPGRIDNMNLSGEENLSLVNSEVKTNNIINLHDLDL